MRKNPSSAGGYAVGFVAVAFAAMLGIGCYVAARDVPDVVTVVRYLPGECPVPAAIEAAPVAAPSVDTVLSHIFGGKHRPRAARPPAACVPEAAAQSSADTPRAIPEPSTVALLAVGAIGLAMRGRA